MWSVAVESLKEVKNNNNKWYSRQKIFCDRDFQKIICLTCLSAQWVLFLRLSKFSKLFLSACSACLQRLQGGFLNYRKVWRMSNTIQIRHVWSLWSPLYLVPSDIVCFPLSAFLPPASSSFMFSPWSFSSPYFPSARLSRHLHTDVPLYLIKAIVLLHHIYTWKNNNHTSAVCLV